MFKKINLILISFCSILVINYNIGYSLFIPIALFYLLKDIKDIYYIIIFSLLSILLFNFNIYIYLINIGLILISYFLIKYLVKKPVDILSNKMLHIITYFIIFFICFISNRILFNYQLINSIIYSFFSLSIYLFLEYTLISFFKKEHNNSIIFLDVFNALLVTLTTSVIEYNNINIGILLSVIYTIILSKKYQHIASFIFSFISMVFYIFVLKENICLFLPIISSFNLLPSIYSLILFNVFCVIGIYTTNIYSNEYILYFMLISVVIELISPFMNILKKEDKIDYNLIEKNLSKKLSSDISNINNLFDSIITIFKKPHDYNKRLENEINNIFDLHCKNCSSKKECFKLYQGRHFDLFKNAILNIDSNDSFYSYCVKGEEINKYINSIKDIKELEKSNISNNNLISAISCMNNCIKKMNVELNNRNIIDLNMLTHIIKSINYYGVNIINYKILKYDIDDFLISITTSNLDKSTSIDVIINIFENVLKKEISIKHEIKDNLNIYYIYPKLSIDIIYGYATLSSNNNFNGDNYFIKEVSNAKLLIGLSDGMGKGKNAFIQSNKTLELVNSASNININFETSLNVINSFYNIQDYFEDYATLDLLYIDRINSICDIYKMGATSSYILHTDNSFEKILNKSLPFGIDTDVLKQTVSLNKGDIIFISSDGIFENITKESKLLEFLINIKDEAPKQIAYSIIDYTVKQKTLTKDDMSVIVVKVKE